MINLFVRSAVLFICLISIQACGPSSQTRPGNAELIAEQELQAQNFINRGEFSAAGEQYLLLAKTDPGNAVLYKLMAAGAFLEDQDLTRAGEILATTSTGDNATHDLQKRILLAKIALGQGDAKSAIETIGPPPAAATPAHLASAYHDVRAVAFESLGLNRDALNERLALAMLPGSAAGKHQNDRMLWKRLSVLDSTELQSMRDSDSGIYSSWIELALIYQTHASNPKNLNAVITDWSNSYPGHSALTNIIPDMIASSAALNQRPRHIAVLLPLTGRYRDASRAIRDGLIAAWHQDDVETPQLSFLNTDSLNVIKNYQQAIQDGADFIIGPLEKAAIDRLLKEGTLTTRTLVLNYFEGDLNGNLLEHVKPG
ncbi:MAG: penicillin-binding protein activator, partial [Thiotrichales bacterium]|nr:penicillin-binding protein activator [Thiotrichales bacterium]